MSVELMLKALAMGGMLEEKRKMSRGKKEKGEGQLIGPCA